MNAPELARVASSPDAPVAERVQARTELEAQFQPTTSDFPDQSAIRSLVEHIQSAYDQGTMAKGGLWQGTGIYPIQGERKHGEAMSLFVDERGMFGTAPGGYKMRPSQFGSFHLRLMVEQTPLINAIILRRQRVIGRFLRTVERNRDLGFEVRRNDETGTVKPRKGPEETALEQFVLHSGWERTPRKRQQLKHDTLTTFMTKSLRDILTLDAWAIETVPTNNGKSLFGYHAVDASTVYLASEEGYQGDDEIIAVQIVDGMPVTKYNADEMAYLTMNPRSDVSFGGYGYAPPEMVVKVVTGYLNALTYNLRGFDANAIPKGLLTIFGSFDQNQLNGFRQQWNAMVRGVNNAWSLPVMVSDSKESSATYTKFDNEFTDMYFAKWMILLTSIICAVYGMDPTEIYAESFHAGRSSLSGSDTAERLADARDTGLEPLMSFLENGMTDYLLSRVAPDYVFRFYGLRPLDLEWKREYAKLTKSVNELRVAEGDEPTTESWGNAPLNPSLVGVYSQAQQAALGGAGQTPEKPEPEARVQESGDRKQPDGDTQGRQPESAVTDQGNRDPAKADQAMAGGYEAVKDDADRDRSTMFRKAVGRTSGIRSDEIVVVG